MAHIVAGNSKFLTGTWSESFSFLLTAGQRSSSVVYHMALDIGQLTTWQPFLQSQQGRETVLPQRTDTVLCIVIRYVQSGTSHHLCCTLLFGSQPQVLPTLRGRESLRRYAHQDTGVLGITPTSVSSSFLAVTVLPPRLISRPSTSFLCPDVSVSSSFHTPPPPAPSCLD